MLIAAVTTLMVVPSFAVAQRTDVKSRGVIVLQPKADPTPGPVIAAPAAPAPAPVRPVIKECARPFADPDLALVDSGALDKALGGRLKRGKRVVLDLPQPYRLGGTPPPELVPWFTEVRAAGGTVTVSQYCQGARGLFGNFLSKLFGARPARPYAVVDGFNAVLHVNALDQQVTQVEFAPREPGKRP